MFPIVKMEKTYEDVFSHLEKFHILLNFALYYTVLHSKRSNITVFDYLNVLS